MAAETNYQSKTDVKIFLGSEANFGTPAVALTGDWFQLPVIDWDFPQPSPPLEVGSMKAGTRVPLTNQAVHRPDLGVYPGSLTMYGTPTVVLKALQLLIEDGASPAVLAGDYAYPTALYKHGIASTSQMTIVGQGAGMDATLNDIVCKSCLATSVEMGEDLNNEGGNLIVKVNFVTFYQPTFENFGNPETYATNITQDTANPKNIRNLTAVSINSEELVPISWNITLSRTLNRILFSDASTFDPYGYEMEGGWQIAGSLIVKNDDSVHDFLASFKNSTAIALSLAEASNFTLSMPTIMLNQPKMVLEETIKQEIPFLGFGLASSITDSVFSFTIA
jgi:hypothetical protein